VFTEFKDNYRSNKNFIRAWGLPEDIDNDHSDKPEDWIYPADIAAFFTNVRHFIHYSRHHMKQKDGRSPRPRFHVDFIIDEEDDYETFANLKKQVFSVFPFFDDQAQDVARFLYGTENPEVEYHDGSLTLTVFMKEYEAADAFANMAEVITEGRRNSTLSRFAGRIIVKLDDTEEARQRFLEEAQKCDVPLPDNELRSIWKSAQGFLKKIKSLFQDSNIDLFFTFKIRINSAFSKLSHCCYLINRGLLKPFFFKQTLSGFNNRLPSKLLFTFSSGRYGHYFTSSK
jgi:hypothetical protein